MGLQAPRSEGGQEVDRAGPRPRPPHMEEKPSPHFTSRTGSCKQETLPRMALVLSTSAGKPSPVSPPFLTTRTYAILTFTWHMRN